MPTLGVKHPASLAQPGHEAWAEIWPVIAPMFQQVHRGEATWSEDQRLFLQGAGSFEEGFHTSSQRFPP